MGFILFLALVTNFIINTFLYGLSFAVLLACVAQCYRDFEFPWMIFFLTALVVYSCFLWKLVRHRHTDVTSFCMQFEKIGLGLLQEAFWSKGVCFISIK